MSDNSLMGHEFTNKYNTIKFVVDGAFFLRDSITFQLDFIGMVGYQGRFSRGCFLFV